MKDPERLDILRLIQAYEELDGDERRRADAALAADPQLRRRLERWQALERAAAEAVAVPDVPAESGPALAVADRAAERASYRHMLEILGLAEPATGRRFSWRRELTPWWRPLRWVPLAGAAAAVILLLTVPGIREPEALIRDLGVVAALEGPTGNRSGSLPAAETGVLRTGQAFALTLTLAREAAVVVVHVDPQGAAALIYPEEAGRTPALLAAAGPLRIPPRDAAADWVLGAGTGRETFLVAAGGDVPDLPVLASQVAGRGDVRAATAVDRERVLEAVRGLLEEQVGPVQRLDLDHRD